MIDDLRNTVIQGGCLEVLRTLPDNCIDCCVTSPPYWGLRDYGVDGQLGLENTIDDYVANMVDVFAEVKRVLKPEGTLWLNLGDTYNNNKPRSRDPERWPKQSRNDHKPKGRKLASTLKQKDLCGIPWRVAFALQDDGWYLRQDIIWEKPNPMPESVSDRCTKAHEYLFLMTKNAMYYCDMEAIKVPLAESTTNDYRTKSGAYTKNRPERGFVGNPSQGSGMLKSNGGTANKRSVWTVTTKPYKEAHFATFPPDLIKPCILAGTSEKGCCPECGSPQVRQVEKERRPTRNVVTSKIEGKEASEYGNRDPHRHVTETRTVGWQPGCDCIDEKATGESRGPDVAYKPISCIVLDPFMGSGTTGQVAYENGRDYLGIELSPEYCKINHKRLSAAKNNLTTKELENGQGSLFGESN